MISPEHALVRAQAQELLLKNEMKKQEVKIPAPM
jgi:hypothetical protein